MIVAFTVALFCLLLILSFQPSASEMTYIVSSGALNSTHSLTFISTEYRIHRPILRFSLKSTDCRHFLHCAKLVSACDMQARSGGQLYGHRH